MSDLNAISSIEEERAHIDERISRLERKLHDLRSRRNTLAPISRLPPELMLEIFRMCRDGAVSSRKLRRWIAEVAHVCQYWRGIVLPACTLWSTPDFSRPDSAAEMLRRCGGSPLDIILVWARDEDRDEDVEELDFFQKGLELARSTLASDINRVRSIDLNMPESHLSELLGQTAGAAPALQSLTLDDIGICHWEHGLHELPAEIFSGQMPNLRALSLNAYYVDLTHPSCANIARLILRNTIPPSNERLHTILQSMSQLRELVLEASLPYEPEEGYSPAPVALPNLSSP